MTNLRMLNTWAFLNKMTVYISKTKEIVFQRPNPHLDVIVDPLSGIEQVHDIEVLGFIFSEKLYCDLHRQFILRQCSHRLYLMTLLKSQGLPYCKLLRFLKKSQ
jgi:hypothetical protein